jgi:dGTPase
MPLSRQELEQRERLTLASFAQASADSRGRQHAEPPADWRTHYQRDRDRVIHSRAFRRLEYKTQVFLNGTGDHLRTRLTHSIEVAAIARNIARALRLNDDLAETIALAHDLGHSPFGHKGEEVLNRLMQHHGGFEHNCQSLRIVEFLEQKYPRFSGLNLTWEVREGLAKHQTSYDHPATPTPADSFGSASLEAQVANLADEITYYSHDLDDGLDSGLLAEPQLQREVRLWRQAARKVKADYGTLPDECRWYFTIRCIIDGQIRDVVRTSETRLRQAAVHTPDDVRRRAEPLIQYSARRHDLNRELRDYLYHHLYYNPLVHEPNQRAVHMMEQLFLHYLHHPTHMGQQARRRARQTGLHRAVCDYIAGMTDRYVILEYERRIGPAPRLPLASPARWGKGIG